MGSMKKKAIKFRAQGKLKTKLKNEKIKKKLKSSKKRQPLQQKNNRSQAEPSAKNAKLNKNPPPDEAFTDAIANDMDVDEFLNADFFSSADERESDIENLGDSDSELENEDALDPQYLVGLPDEESIAIHTKNNKKSTAVPVPEAEDEQSEAEHEESEAEIPKDNETVRDLKDFSMEELIRLEKECYENQSIKAFRKIIKVFSDACQPDKDANDTKRGDDLVYSINNSSVYTRLMVHVLQKSHIVFSKLLYVAKNEHTNADGSKQRQKIDDKKWTKHKFMILRFFQSITRLLEGHCSQEIQLFVLQQITNYLPFATPCNKLPRRLLKTLLRVWAKSTQNHQLCMIAFLRIRELTLLLPMPFIELVLKGVYLTYMRNCKYTHEMNCTHQIIMGNCVVELYGLDIVSSYQHAFVYIRQLAIVLRKTIKSPSADTFRAIINWQFINQLRVWSAVISAYSDENQLRPLLYPLCQLIMATVRLASTIRFAPLRFQCVKMLQQLALSTNSFIPASQILLEMLTMPPFNNSYRGNSKILRANSGNAAKLNGTPSKAKALDLDLSLRINKATMESKQVHDLILFKLFELLQRENDIYKYDIGYPELTVPWTMRLKKYMQHCKISRWKSLAKGICDAMARQAAFIREKRSNLDICPKDIDQAQAFLRAEKDELRAKLLANEVNVLQNRLEEETLRPTPISMPESGEEEQPKVKRAKIKECKDDAVFAEVKDMSMEEFKAQVAQTSEKDQVEPFDWTDEEENNS